ncbi:MAG: hypothetical protein AAB730_00030 [Patescibacteria group bacterium]
MKKALKNLGILLVLVVLAGCSTGGRDRYGYYRGGNNNAGIIAAGAVIGAAILGAAYIGSKQADVQKEAIRASTVSAAACNLGGKGSAGYESSEGGATINADVAYSAEQCAEIKKAQLQAVSYGYRGYQTADPHAICDTIASPNGRARCHQDVEQQFEYEARRRAMEAARLRY